jgi:hypothetical protein
MMDDSYDTGKPILNSQAIIVLDENMKKVGEIILPKKQYFTPTMFITKEGLCKEKVNFENEDLLLYDVFDVIKESRQ